MARKTGEKEKAVLIQIGSKIIAAGIKDVRQVIDSILAGADMVAVPYGIFKNLFRHPLIEE